MVPVTARPTASAISLCPSGMSPRRNPRIRFMISNLKGSQRTTPGLTAGGGKRSIKFKINRTPAVVDAEGSNLLICSD